MASTGAAAIRIDGRTFHSFFGLGIMEGGYEQTIENALRDKRVLRRIKKAIGIVIDEISMIPGVALKAAEEISRWARGSEEPWGGLKLIAVGDFFQLPPVHRNGERKDWAFSGMTWEKSCFQPAVLREIIRTTDQDFLKVLGKVRLGEVDAVAGFLDSKVIEEDENPTGTRLFGRRFQTEAYNLNELKDLPGEPSVVETLYEGKEYGIRALKKQAPIPEKLVLKVGAFVMVRQNDPQGRWVNGTLGHISRIGTEAILVETMAGSEIEIKKTVFSLLDADMNKVAACSNFPLNLAYATTIHKAQGVTLDAAVIDLRNLWEPGQAYVAMSRLRSSQGLHLLGWSKNSFQTDPSVLEFYKNLENLSTSAI